MDILANGRNCINATIINMSYKKIKLSIAGQEVVCNFGINYFYRHYKDITGIDPMVGGFGEVEGLELFDTIGNIFYAGYRAESSLKKAEPVLSKEDFIYYVMSMDRDGVNKMSEEFTNLIVTKEDQPGEQAAQTISP